MRENDKIKKRKEKKEKKREKMEKKIQNKRKKKKRKERERGKFSGKKNNWCRRKAIKKKVVTGGLKTGEKKGICGAKMWGMEEYWGEMWAVEDWR